MLVFFSSDRNDHSVVVFDRRNNFLISFTSFHVLVELRPAVASFRSTDPRNVSCAVFVAASSSIHSRFSST